MAKTWNELYLNLALESKKRKEFIASSFELTARCNLQCKMCYVRYAANDKQAKAKELTTEQWVRLAEEARDAGLLFLTLTGGEVLLRKDFKELYEKLMNLGLIIKIFTNGTLITPEFVNWLSRIPPKLVSITLYGASRDTYKKVTGFADGYDRATRAVDLLMDKGIPTEIKTTVTQYNRADFDEIHNFALKRKCVLGVVNYIAPVREGCNTASCECRLSPEELLNFEIHMTERGKIGFDNEIIGETEKTVNPNDDAVAEAMREILASKAQTDENFAFQCMSGSCTGWVNWDGSMAPCGIMGEPKVYPLISGFQNAWVELKQKCAQIPVCKACKECEYQVLCEHCPGRLYQETGSYDKPAPYLCELAKRRTDYNNQKNN
ncbi:MULTISPECIES: radical SAM protein [Dehalobacter]|uniref:Radical SAM protein n=1 Tax=Dehalobacter restrictus (strain DSM 9455 / PER-K23) TaxID=871738 RepID=A0ABN4BSG6_DEHRP|nr:MULTISPECIES: radical SAM protein [Dehalobacter]AHF10341.1 radical SAM protein [Dehalobacter restrictus DSM 9455]MDJ0305585.1 radical SAM protein [Dehalobacter sp.]